MQVLIAEDGGTYVPLGSGYSFYDNGTLIPESEWYSYLTDEGEHTFTVKYLTLSETFSVEVVDSTKVITPYHVQAENSIFMYTDETQQTETDNPWSKNENYSSYSVNVSYIENYLQYGASFPETNIYDLEAIYSGEVMQNYAHVKRIVPHGAEGAAVSNTEKYKNYYYKFDVYVPEDGNYDLFARAQATNPTSDTHVFDINIDERKNEDSGALIYEECSESSTDTTANGGNIVSGSKGYVIEGNQRYIEGTETLDGRGYFNMYYWSTVKIATIKLSKGDHTIRLRPTGNAIMNTDYFSLEKAGTTTAASEPLIINERDGSGSVIGENDAIVLEGGEKLGDITKIPEGPFLHYTLLYLRLYDYKNLSDKSPFYEEVPITEEDISGIDYTKAGKQTATVNFTAPNGTEYSAQFNVIITDPSDPDDLKPYEEPYLVSIGEVTPPTKTTYIEGQIFDPSGMEINSVWMVNGKETNMTLKYTACESWTHKDEPLSLGTDKITFTLYGKTFDVDITVKELTGSLLINASALRSQYSTDEVIDLTKVQVFIAEEGGEYVPLGSGYSFYDNDTLVPASEWSSYVTDEGMHTFTVKYLSLEETFTVEVVDSTKVITPYHVQAEDSIYMYSDSTQKEELDTRWTKKESVSYYVLNVSYIEELQGGEPFPETNKYDLEPQYSSDGKLKDAAFVSKSVPHGAEGDSKAAVSGTDQRKDYFYKFDVYVPEDGNYDLFVRAQSSNPKNSSHIFNINIDGRSDTDGALIYEECTANATDTTASGGNIVSGSVGNVINGNQRYIDDEATTLDGTVYYNMYYWSTVKIATIKLSAGNHTIRLQPTGLILMNTDYFFLEKEGTTTTESEPLIINERDGSGSVIGENDAIYLNAGEKLGDISNVPEGPFLHYTLIYLRLYNYTLNGLKPLY